MCHLSNSQIILYIMESSPETNSHSKISSLLRDIEKYVIKSRKQKEKDGFV